MNELKSFAGDLVSHYATFDESDGFYSLDLCDLPDFVQDEFAAVIMGSDCSFAAEATGPDNMDWDLIMLPALMRYLKNSTDKDEAIEFNNVWRRSITRYFFNTMQELINDALQDYNDDSGYSVKDWGQYYGVTHLFGA